MLSTAFLGIKSLILILFFVTLIDSDNNNKVSFIDLISSA